MLICVFPHLLPGALASELQTHFNEFNEPGPTVAFVAGDLWIGRSGGTFERKGGSTAP